MNLLCIDKWIKKLSTFGMNSGRTWYKALSFASGKMHGLWGLVEMVNEMSKKKDKFCPKLEWGLCERV